MKSASDVSIASNHRCFTFKGTLLGDVMVRYPGMFKKWHLYFFAVLGDHLVLYHDQSGWERDAEPVTQIKLHHLMTLTMLQPEMDKKTGNKNTERASAHKAKYTRSISNIHHFPHFGSFVHHVVYVYVIIGVNLLTTQLKEHPWSKKKKKFKDVEEFNEKLEHRYCTTV